MALRTVVYLRKSTKDKDEKQVRSIPRQLREIEDFVEKYNATCKPHEKLEYDPEKDVYSEDASAKIVGEENRKQFHTMVREIKKYKYDVLLCTELSRLSRNAVDSGTLVQLLEEDEKTKKKRKKKKTYLLKIRTVDSVFEPTPTSKFTLSLFLSVSKFENDQRAENTASGLDRQKERGVTTHKATLGYKNVGEEKGKKSVIKCPDNWDKVRELWDDMLSEQFKVSDVIRKAKYDLKIKHWWDEELVCPSDSTFREMFRNKYYVGKVKRVNRKTGDVTWVKGHHPPMVSEPEFEKVQLILQSQGYRHQSLDKSVSIETILSEIMVCGKCKTEKNGLLVPTKMIFERKVRYTCTRCNHRYASAEQKSCPKCGTEITKYTKVDESRYYRCGKKQSSKACSHNFYGDGAIKKNLQADKIEQYFDGELSKLHITEKLFEVLKRQLYTLWLADHEMFVAEKKKKTNNKEKLEQERIKLRKKSLLEELSEMDKEDIEVLMQENKQKQRAIDSDIDEIDEKIEEKFEKAWQSLQALREAKSILKKDQEDIEPIRRLVLSMVSNLKITDEKWEIIWRKPFDVVAKASIA
ncbi:MAG: recombinase family protein, partial [Bacteroidales bacterium]|nr:recombinase family protein [Bacteroidales bacterium]